MPQAGAQAAVKRPLEILVLALLLAVNAFVLAAVMFRFYQLLDFGAFFDAAWRIYRGQKPYVDFYFHSGPVHLQSMALFFKVLGVGKTAFLAQPLLIGSVCMTLVFFTGRCRLPLIFRALASLLTGAGLYWGYPHPWYDMTAHFWGILALTLLMGRLPFEEKKEALVSGAACGFLAVLAFLTKTNIGLAYIGSLGAVLLYGPKRTHALAGYAAGAFAAAVLGVLFIVPDTAAYYENALVLYGSGRSNQMLRLLFLRAWLKNLYWLPFAAVLFTAAAARRRPSPLFALFVMTALLAIFDLNTGSLRDPDHLPVFGVFLSIGFLALEELKPQGIAKIMALAAKTVLTAAAVFQIYVVSVSARMHYDLTHPMLPHGNYELKTGPLKGWMFYPPYGEAVDGIAEFIHANIPHGESLLIMSDLYLLNPMTGRDSYRGVSYMWPMFFHDAPIGARPETVRANILANPPDWILVKREEGQISDIMALMAYFQFPESFLKEYGIVRTWGPYGMLRRIPAAQSA